MIDIRLIRTNPNELSRALGKKGVKIDFSEFLSKDALRRNLSSQNDNLRSEKKKLSKEFVDAKKSGLSILEIEEKIKKMDDDIAFNETEIKELDIYINDVLYALPNPPADDVCSGGKENNVVIKTFGEKPAFEFPPKDHMELSQINNLIDYERGVKLSGNGFWIYRGIAAQLEWALLNYFVSEHLADNYEMLLLPHILNDKCGFVAGQFPKFIDEVFYINESNNFILPTAETALVNLHRDEILNEQDLPLKYFAYTPCYRKEAGSYRKEERGMIRGHQFNKVELFQYAHPDKSNESLNEMLEKAEKLVRNLGLHYQVTKLAAQDCSWAMSTTYDIEVWIPSMEIYKEVSSVSNAMDYQARRGNIRFKDTDKKEMRHVHTLNASGLATSRILPAIFEQYQQEDGRIRVPDVLKKWLPIDYLI